MAVANAFLCQGVDVRGNGIGMSVASKDGAHVLRRDPKQVGFPGRKKGGDQNEQGQKKACWRKDALLKVDGYFHEWIHKNFLIVWWQSSFALG